MISRAGEQFGPYSEEDLRGYVGSGQVLPDDLAWTEGMADWLPVSQIFQSAQEARLRPRHPHSVNKTRGWRQLRYLRAALGLGYTIWCLDRRYFLRCLGIHTAKLD
jgi:hypothetical protein